MDVDGTWKNFKGEDSGTCNGKRGKGGTNQAVFRLDRVASGILAFHVTFRHFGNV